MRIRLRQIWAWKCPNCGQDNYEEPARVSNEEGERILRECLGLDPWESTPDPDDINFVPTNNRCRKCGRVYASVPDGAYP